MNKISIKQLAKLCSILNFKISVAESCTAGLLSAKLTSIAGSSLFFDRGFVTYSNKAKIEILNIAESMIEKFGPVSKEIAFEMAKSVARISNSQIGISITGIAGPGKDEKNTPVGLVYIGISIKNKTEVYQFNFTGNRHQIRNLAVENAVQLTINSMNNLL